MTSHTPYYIYARAKQLPLLLLLALLVACSDGDDDAPAVVSMPVYISIPATDVYDTTRAPGDPGTYERFGLPRYLCLVMVEVEPESGTRTIVARSMNVDLGKDATNWRRTTMTATPAGTPTAGDSLYTYVGRQITINLPANHEGTPNSAEVYAALSPLPFKRDGKELTADDIKDGFLDMQVDFEPETIGGADSYTYLRDVYSTPFNLTHTAGSYYGTIENEKYKTSYPSLQLVLYHVAAKLDLQWNVSADVKDAGGVKSVELLTVSGLKHNGCYLFKPMKNEGAGTDTYSETITTDPGNCYYGRQSLYVIPYVTSSTTKFPVAMQATLTLNDGTTTTKSATHEVTLDREAVFTPWIVGALTIK